MKHYKDEILKQICEGAKLYKEGLCGKTFLYIAEDGTIVEIMFQKKHYKHLTGVDSSLHAKDFFKKACKGQLSRRQIYFSKVHPYRLAKKKTEQLLSFISILQGELFLLENVETETKSYRFGTTDMNITLCLEKDSNTYAPISLRIEDCFNKSDNVKAIDCILSKRNGDNKYTNLVYVDNSCNIETLLSRFKYLVDIDI